MWPKWWSFSFSISPSSEYSRLISFRMDWFDLLAVQVTLKSLLQHHSSKALILQHSAFFIVQLSHLFMTTGKTIALTILDLCRQSDVSAFFFLMSLLFNTLSRLVITFFPRSSRATQSNSCLVDVSHALFILCETSVSVNNLPGKDLQGHVSLK